MKKTEEIFRTLRGVLAEVKPELALPANNDELATKVITKDLGLDSLDLINTLFRLEELCGIKIPEADLDSENLVVAGNLVSYIAKKQ